MCLQWSHTNYPVTAMSTSWYSWTLYFQKRKLANYFLSYTRLVFVHRCNSPPKPDNHILLHISNLLNLRLLQQWIMFLDMTLWSPVEGKHCLCSQGRGLSHWSIKHWVDWKQCPTHLLRCQICLIEMLKMLSLDATVSVDTWFCVTRCTVNTDLWLDSMWQVWESLCLQRQLVKNCFAKQYEGTRTKQRFQINKYRNLQLREIPKIVMNLYL